MLNGGEAQFQGVGVRTGYETEDTGVNTRDQTGYRVVVATGGSHQRSPTWVLHLVVVDHGQSLHGVVDGLPLQQTRGAAVARRCSSWGAEGQTEVRGQPPLVRRHRGIKRSLLFPVNIFTLTGLFTPISSQICKVHTHH